MANDDSSLLRGQLVDRLSDAGHVFSKQVAEAFRAVPRHVFLPGVELQKAYADQAVVTKWESDGQPISSSSQPAVMAMMLEQPSVQSGQRVLEIGGAAMAHLLTSGRVTAATHGDDRSRYP